MATEYDAETPLEGVGFHDGGFSELDMQLRQPVTSFLGDDIAMATPSEAANYIYEHQDDDHEFQSHTYSEQDVPRWRSWDSAGDPEDGLPGTQYKGEQPVSQQDNDLPDVRYDEDYVEFPEPQDIMYERQTDGGLEQEDEMEDEMEEDDVEYDEDEDYMRDMVQEAEWNYLHEELQYPAPLPFTDADLADPPDTESVEELVTQKRSEGYFQERWEVDKETATFLALLARDEKADKTEDMRYYIPTPLRHLKAEEPVLQCDPATEMRAVLKRNEVHLTSKSMTPFELDANNDESLEWGATNLALPERMKKELAAEKWHVDNETMAFMKSVIAQDDESLEDWVRRERERKVC